MTKRTVKQKSRGTKTKAAKGTIRPEPTPPITYELMKHEPWDGEVLRDGLSATDLIGVCFSASNGYLNTSPGAFFDNVVACVVDELDLADSALMDEVVNEEAVRRVIRRAIYRLKVGREVARRLESRISDGGAS